MRPPARLLALAFCALALPAAPRAGEPAKRVALVLLEKGSPSRKLIDAFVAALAAIDVGDDSVSIVGKRELHRQLGPTYLNAVVACGGDLRCIAALGDKADATQVLFGRATAEKGGVALQWLLVDVKTASIVGKLKASLTPGGADAAAAKVASELLRLGAAAEAAEPVAKQAPAERAPAPAPAPAPEPAPAPAAKAASKWSALGVAGTAALACGAISIGAGVASARDDGQRANTLLGVGGALVLGGVALWTWDSVEVGPVVSIGSTAGYAGLAGTW